MEIKRHKRHIGTLSALMLGWMIGTVMPTAAQDNTKPTPEKWRPKNGIYAGFDKSFTERCKNLGDYSVELGEKKIVGDEWSCDVIKLTDTGPGAIRLDLSCIDENLQAEIPNHGPDPGEPQFKETMTFRKVDETSLLMRKSQNGKTNFPETRDSYCPPKDQRAYRESKANEKAKAQQSEGHKKE